MKVGEQFAEANLTEGSRNSTRKDAKILGSQTLFNDFCGARYFYIRLPDSRRS